MSQTRASKTPERLVPEPDMLSLEPALFVHELNTFKVPTPSITSKEAKVSPYAKARSLTQDDLTTITLEVKPRSLKQDDIPAVSEVPNAASSAFQPTINFHTQCSFHPDGPSPFNLFFASKILESAPWRT